MKVFLVIVCFILGAAGAIFIFRYAFRLGLVDQPNVRSSHSLPTQRGGGIGILAAFILSSLIIGIPVAFWFPASLIATASFFDDRLGLTPKLRLLLQFLAAAIVLTGVGSEGSNIFIMSLLLISCAIYIVGTANFYNFMDGYQRYRRDYGSCRICFDCLFCIYIGRG